MRRCLAALRIFRKRHKEEAESGAEWPFLFTREIWERCAKAVQSFITALMKRIEDLEKTEKALRDRIAELESRLKRNSRNANKPPLTDAPYGKGKKEKGSGKKPGAKRGHKGHRQAMLEPTHIEEIKPEQCPCGNTEFPETEIYTTHQRIENPPIQMEVTHDQLHRGNCSCCGKLNKATVPPEFRTGYGPRLCATVAQLAGGQGDSRTLTQEFVGCVLGVHISLGAIQKIIDRVSLSLVPLYEGIAEAVRKSAINHLDKPSYSMKDVLQWLWVMGNSMAAYFMIHAHRNKVAFNALIANWSGVLVSDGYGVYRKWVGLRQTCLAHLIRGARKLSESPDAKIAKCGKWACVELQKLCHMAQAPPNLGEGDAFTMRFSRLISLHADRKDDAGKFARRLRREMLSLWVFLEKQGVSPTNNHAERLLRFAVCRRRRSQGIAAEKGNRWVERTLSVRQTCRPQKRPLFPSLVEAIDAHFHGRQPDLSWIKLHLLP